MPPYESPSVYFQQTYPQINPDTFILLRRHNREFQDMFFTTIVEGRRRDIRTLLEAAAVWGDIEAFRFILSHSGLSAERLQDFLVFLLFDINGNDTRFPNDRFLAMREIFRRMPAGTQFDEDLLSGLIDEVPRKSDILYSEFVAMLNRLDLLDDVILTDLYESAVEQDNVDIVSDIVEVQDLTNRIVTFGEFAGKQYAGRYYLPALLKEKEATLNYLMNNCVLVSGGEDVLAEMLNVQLPDCVER